MKPREAFSERPKGLTLVSGEGHKEGWFIFSALFRINLNEYGFRSAAMALACLAELEKSGNWLAHNWDLSGQELADMSELAKRVIAEWQYRERTLI